MAHSWTEKDTMTWRRLISRADAASIARRRHGRWTSQSLGELSRTCRSARKACFPAHGIEDHGRLMAFLSLCESLVDSKEGRDLLIAAVDRGVSIARAVLDDGEAPPPARSAAARLPYREN